MNLRSYIVKRMSAVALALAILAALTLAMRPAAAGNKGDEAKAQLRDAAGVVVGEAKFEQEHNGVDVRIKVSGLTPGFHGFHIHTTGACVAPDFVSAGSHYNPDGHNHGAHAGDMPVLLVNANGIGEARFTTTSFQVAQLFDTDGSALIVHAGPDNYANIPPRYEANGPDATTLGTGDSGGRTACGVIALDD
jgi:Cu-Zn family superoxide dismutase